MNISSHTILCNKYHLGQLRPDGFVGTDTTFALTQFFPFILSTSNIFPIPSNWRNIYGNMFMNTGSPSSVLLSSNSLTSFVPFTIYDSVGVPLASKPFSLILY